MRCFQILNNFAEIPEIFPKLNPRFVKWEPAFSKILEKFPNLPEKIASGNRAIVVYTACRPFSNICWTQVLDPWQSVSMDFIMELPPSSGYNAICVCIEGLTKMAHFIPTTTELTAEDTATLNCKDAWRLHGLPVDIVSDCGSQFI